LIESELNQVSNISFFGKYDLWNMYMPGLRLLWIGQGVRYLLKRRNLAIYMGAQTEKTEPLTVGIGSGYARKESTVSKEEESLS